MTTLIPRLGYFPKLLIAVCALLPTESTIASARHHDPQSEMPLKDSFALSDSFSPLGMQPGASSDPATNVAAYVIGDRLKIAFFEVVVDPEQERDRTVSELIERTEFSGEYIVQDDGDIFLPLFGSVSVSGHTPRQLESELERLFKSNLTRNGKVSIVLAKREPIYIVGPVTKPGAHEYSPGMTVMHAIALSEGLGATYTDFSRAAETIRERERLDKSAREMQLLLARQSALMAERDGAPAAVPQRLRELTGADQGRTLVSVFVSERKLLSAAREARTKSLEATIEAAKHEIGLLRARLVHLQDNVHNRTARLNTVVAMRQRGSFNEHALYLVQNELSDVLEREDSVKATLAQTEEKLSQARHEITRLEADTKMELYKELRTIEHDLIEAELIQRSSERLIRAAGSDVQNVALTPNDLFFAIVRRTESGQKRIDATAMSLLQAGDLLEISRKPTLASQ